MKLQWTAGINQPNAGTVSAKTRKTGTRIFRQRIVSGASIRFTDSWYMSKMICGKRKLFPLGKAPAEAIRIADEVSAFLAIQGNSIDDALQRYNPRALSRPGGYASVGDVIETHKESIRLLELKEETAANYYKNLLMVIRKVESYRRGIEPVQLSKLPMKEREALNAKVLDKSLSILDDSLLLDYQRYCVADEDMDEEEMLSAKISANTVIRCARSLFGVECMKLYREKHLQLPDMSAFMGVSYYKAQKFFELPSMNVIEKMFSSSSRLKKDNPDQFRAWFAAVHTGMRRCEVIAFSPSWIERNGDNAYIQLREKGVFKPKHGHGRTINIPLWVAEELTSLSASPSAYMGECYGTATAACTGLVGWMRDIGFDAGKPMHELRKLWTCMKAKTEGILAAQKQAGHKDANTTSKFYADNKLSETVLPFWTNNKAS